MRRKQSTERIPLAGDEAEPTATVVSRPNPYYDGPPSDHFDGKLFFNPGGIPPASFRDLLRWQTGGGRSKWPSHWPSPHPQARPEARVEGLRLTMVGHSTLLIQTAGLNILTDPVCGRSAPRRCRSPGRNASTRPALPLTTCRRSMSCSSATTTTTISTSRR